AMLRAPPGGGGGPEASSCQRRLSLPGSSPRRYTSTRRGPVTGAPGAGNSRETGALDHGHPSDDRDRGGLLRHRIGVMLTATLLLCALVMLPLLLSSVSGELIGHPDGVTYALTPRDDPAPAHSPLH